MEPDDKQRYPLWQPLNAQLQDIRLIRIIPRDDDAIVECQLDSYSLCELSAHYARFNIEHSGDDLEGPERVSILRNVNVRDKWVKRHNTPQLEAIWRINSHQPGRHLHRFAWGDFACLSYVWGNRGNSRMIIVNGNAVDVTENLDAALRQYRRDGLFCGKFLLWVDALCINQLDREEQANEVQRMSDIYRSAWTVEAWLGIARFNSQAGLQLLRDIAEFRKAGREQELERSLRVDPNFLGSTGWLGLHDIMDRSYWYRLWIVQEIVMGGASVWVWCGGSSIPWPTFCEGVVTLQEHLWLVKDRCLVNDVHGRGYPAWKTSSLHLVYQDLATLGSMPLSRRSQHAFGRLLDLSNAGKCKDERDKVYALLGLFPPTVAARLRPDYSATHAEVFAATARAFMEDGQSLDPLREGNPWGPSGCPSWAADWFWEGRIRYCRVEHRLWGPTYLFPPSDNDEPLIPYQASGPLKSEFAFSTNDRVLECNGFIVDEITGLSAAAAGYFQWDPDTTSITSSWHSVYGDFAQTREALVRTLLMDRVRFGKKPGQRHLAVLHLPANFARAGRQFWQKHWTWLASQEGYWFRWEGFRKSIAEFPLGEWAFGDFFDDEIPEGANEYDYTEAYACVERSVKKRRFMLTLNGYMGWAPDNMFADEPMHHTRPGDLIAIVFGCSTPLVIRPIGEEFQVIGEAYVQGLMDGEATQQQLEILRFTFR
ncbi:heterokaryon incompatibility protein-domain-containing protein [Boeremia exigua]|uniref:heterokaryon incompatibility protein-domain-containing protein n=1 Tax=Boeremia exigua TaxID=749465 RepID=UPI001E8E90C2|nr:heterokaryon incompatibility protein-domain-containing protein [Boeremia exigua]KAH6644891.1 heterokaryon incompatibility protein-domain-containing protein [Boeremia exigua]